MTDITAEERDFRIGKNIIRHLIHDQAGTLPEAICEYVMNSIDAGSTTVEIEIGEAEISIIDDGHGISTIEEIHEFFETLCFDRIGKGGTGQHFGKFGMGRSQLFKFAKTTWRTSTFKMVVDIQRREDGYELHPGKEPIKGCHVRATLFDKISERQKEEVVQALESRIAFCSTVVRINGKTATRNPRSVEDWTIETDDAFIRLEERGRRQLPVYNMGVLVEADAWIPGCSGLVVSKKRLNVNMVRNHVMPDCPVWGRIKNEIRKYRTRSLQQEKRITDADRDFLWQSARRGEIERSRLLRMPLFKCIDGNSRSFQFIAEGSKARPLILGNDFRKVPAELIQSKGIGWVLSPIMAYWLLNDNDSGFGYHCIDDQSQASAEEQFFSVLSDIFMGKTFNAMRFFHAEELVQVHAKVVQDEKLDDRERAILRALRSLKKSVGWALEDAGISPERARMREIYLGEAACNSTYGWTDGHSMIAINRNHARRIWKGTGYISHLIHTLLHEYCHDGCSEGEHPHDIAFFSAFHELASSHGQVMQIFCKNLADEYRATGIKVTPPIEKFSKALEAAQR